VPGVQAVPRARDSSTSLPPPPSSLSTSREHRPPSQRAASGLTPHPNPKLSAGVSRFRRREPEGRAQEEAASTPERRMVPVTRRANPPREARLPAAIRGIRDPFRSDQGACAAGATRPRDRRQDLLLLLGGRALLRVGVTAGGNLLRLQGSTILRGRLLLRNRNTTRWANHQDIPRSLADPQQRAPPGQHPASPPPRVLGPIKRPSCGGSGRARPSPVMR